MNAPLINRIAAYYLPIVAQTGGVIGVAVVAYLLGAFGLAGVSAWMWFAIIVAIAAAYAGGAMLGTIFIGFLLRVPFRRIQGAPFQIGDTIMILRGPRKGKVAEVYETWPPRSQVRVRLSDDEAKAVADVFSDFEIMKIRK